MKPSSAALVETIRLSQEAKSYQFSQVSFIVNEYLNHITQIHTVVFASNKVVVRSKNEVL